MPTINDQAFVKSIRQGEFANLYMLYGKETYMLEGCLKLLLDRAVTVQKMLNLNRFDGAKCTLEEIENVTETLPVLAPRRCVVEMCIRDSLDICLKNLDTSGYTEPKSTTVRVKKNDTDGVYYLVTEDLYNLYQTVIDYQES